MNRADVVFGLLIVGLFIGVAWAGLWVRQVSCYAHWEQSSYAVEWGVFRGCVVLVEGRWIPEDNVREIP